MVHGLVNFVPAVAYLFCLNLHAAFSQPCTDCYFRLRKCRIAWPDHTAFSECESSDLLIHSRFDLANRRSVRILELARLRAHSVCGTRSAAVWQSLTQFSTQAVLMDRITAAAAPQHEYGWRGGRRRAVFYCSRFPTPSPSPSPSPSPRLPRFEVGRRAGASSSSSPSLPPSSVARPPSLLPLAGAAAAPPSCHLKR